jgi:serine/threonine-protein kinase
MLPCPYCASPLPEEVAATCPTCGAALTSQTLEPGALVASKYRVERVLGQGGFGITYLALDESLEHRVAVKELFPTGSVRKGTHVIPPPDGNFLEVKENFLDEARVVQRFDHNNIVRVYGTFEDNATAYIVMEALEGQSLQQYITEFGAMPEDDVLHLVAQLCSALERVHASGLLHRDVKPDNVLLSSDGRAVLLDFGSARAFTQGQVKALTRMVTPGFAPLEQYATQAKFGTYTDVYGLAATVYFALEGIAPPSAVDRVNGMQLPKPKNARGFEDALEAGLAVQVAERTQTVTAFRQSLEGAPVIGERLRNLAAATPQFIATVADVDVHGDRLVTPYGVYYFQDFDGYCVENGIQVQLISPNTYGDTIVLVGGAVLLLGGILSAIFPTSAFPVMVFLGIVLIGSGLKPNAIPTSVKTWKFSLTRASSNQPQAERFLVVEVDSENDRASLEAHLAKFLPRVV